MWLLVVTALVLQPGHVKPGVIGEFRTAALCQDAIKRQRAAEARHPDFVPYSLKCVYRPGATS